MPEHVVFVAGGGYPTSLELHKICRIPRDDDAARSGDLRVVDESGEDCLFLATSFVAIGPPGRVGASLLRATSS